MAKVKRIKPLAPQELSAFFTSLGMLLRAGVPVNEAAGIIASDMEGSPLSAASKNIDTIFASGEVFLLSAAMEQSGSFPRYAVEMMQLGEESGRIEAAADSLGEYYHHQSELNQSIRSAVSGPLLLLIMMSVVLFFLILFVLPVYNNVFASLGVAGGVTLDAAYIAAQVAMVIACVLLAVFVVGLLVYLTPGGRVAILKLVQTLPFTRNIHYDISASRLTHGLQMLLASGISSSEALKKAGALVESKAILANLPACQKAVDEGEDLGKALVNTGVLGGFEAKILISASRAGQTESAMGRLSEIYSTQANASIDRLISVIEPALVGLLSVAIGIILLSVMLPLANIMSAIN